MQGVLHNLRIEFKTHKQMQRLFAAKNEVVSGAYVAAENTIYIDKELPEESVLHTLLHEWVHAMEEHTRGMDEEAKCDIVAAAIVKMLGLKHAAEVLLPDERLEIK